MHSGDQTQICAALDKEAADRFWKEAKAASTNSMKNLDQWKLLCQAPFTQQVYILDWQKAIHAVGYLHEEKYRKQTDDGQYPHCEDPLSGDIPNLIWIRLVLGFYIQDGPRCGSRLRLQPQHLHPALTLYEIDLNLEYHIR